MPIPFISDSQELGHLGLKKWLALKAAKALFKERIEQHPLWTLIWECTHRCNLNCRHCGSDCRAQALHPDMPAEDFFRVLDKSISPKIDPEMFHISIAGGEVLLREDLYDIGREIQKRGYPWTFVTNGMLLNSDKLEQLCDAGLERVALSLDGPPEIHNHIRQNPESYQHAVNALQCLVQSKELKLYDVITCVTPPLLPHLVSFRDFLISAGCKKWRLATISPMGRARNNPDLLLNGGQIRQLLDFIVQTRKEAKIHANFTCDGFTGCYEGEVRDNFYQCDAGITIGSILIDGSISACNSIRSNHIQGNIYQDDFMEVWENRFQQFRDRRWTKKGICAHCEMYSFCEGNGMHLYDDNDNLLHCDYHEMKEWQD
ncbi:MAG: TIGR04133 family radical SAM/SPASM protein [Proteobacteria bacterium]|nr:TIGR04133 family radical SAM/SPASM protein [Pseudomonadota bacterium]